MQQYYKSLFVLTIEDLECLVWYSLKGFSDTVSSVMMCTVTAIRPVPQEETHTHRSHFLSHLDELVFLRRSFVFQEI